MRVGFVLEAKIDVLNCWKFLKTHCYNEGIIQNPIVTERKRKKVWVWRMEKS